MLRKGGDESSAAGSAHAQGMAADRAICRFCFRRNLDPERRIAERTARPAPFYWPQMGYWIWCLSRRLSFSGLPPTRPRARAAFNPASVRLRMTLRSNSAFCSSPQNADMRSPRLCGVVNGIRGRTVHQRRESNRPTPWVLTQIDLSRF